MAADQGGTGRWRIGPYTVIRGIGAGGFGETFLAEDRHGAQVVVKRLHTEAGADPESVERFCREVEAGHRVNSRYVARVLDHDLRAQPPWIAFAHIPGRDLADLIADEAPLPRERLAAIAGQLALGLADLWDRGLVHRDLKPANIRVGANDSITIIDLGIAWHPQNTALTAGLAPATLMYASPWAFDPQQEPAPAWDAWAFGLILTELATGRHPFHAIRRNPQALMLRILAPDNPIPDTRPVRAWNLIAQRCCRTDPPPGADDVLLGVAVLEAQAGDIGGALAIAERITGTWSKDGALSGAAVAAARVGDVDGALAIAERITDPERKDGALRGAAAEVGDVDRALAIAEQITDTRSKDRALSSAAQAAAKAGDMDRALAIAERIRDKGRKDDALSGVAWATAWAGDVDRALAIAERITDQRSKDGALSGAAAGAAKAGDVDRALVIAEQITDTRSKDGALSSAAQAAAWAGDMDGALAIAERITDPERKDFALRDIERVRRRMTP